MSRGRVSFSEFSRDLLATCLEARSPALDYLLAYLSDLKATSVLREYHYIDRHFLDDFVNYYARSFNAPPPSCGRLHFFRRLDATALERLVSGAYAGAAEREAAQASLQEHYLGFVVRRPLSSASLGRSVLKTYDSDSNRRHYTVIRPYQVNVSGLKLSVHGLAYQQQDRGAAVCASTALWSALQRVAHVDGHRTPTPSAITKAAGNPFPASSGLNHLQMAAALCELGYLADAIAPAENRSLFRAQLVSCLQSQLPVILLIHKWHETGAGKRRVAHAVTVTGFSEPQDIVGVPGPQMGVDPIQLRSGSLDVVYVHDDNLGSHAHYELVDSDENDEDGNKKLLLRRGRTNKPPVTWWKVDEWVISGAIVPKPAKLRFPIANLLGDLLFVRRAVEKTLPGLQLNYAARFATGVTYRDSLFSMALNQSEVRDFHFGLSLPRHVGVYSAHDGATHLLDAVLDVSEVPRDVRRPSILAIVAPGVSFLSEAHANIERVRRELAADPTKISVITGPESTT